MSPSNVPMKSLDNLWQLNCCPYSLHCATLNIVLSSTCSLSWEDIICYPIIKLIRTPWMHLDMFTVVTSWDHLTNQTTCTDSSESSHSWVCRSTFRNSKAGTCFIWIHCTFKMCLFRIHFLKSELFIKIFSQLDLHISVNKVAVSAFLSFYVFILLDDTYLFSRQHDVTF